MFYRAMFQCFMNYLSMSQNLLETPEKHNACHILSAQLIFDSALDPNCDLIQKQKRKKKSTSS